MKFSVSFNNADPKHARVNPLRARRDKPHFWFEEGWWRVSPRPIRRRQAKGFKSVDWSRAHAYVNTLNMRLGLASFHRGEVAFIKWEVVRDDAIVTST